MTDDVYQRLAEHLDTLPQRFPSNTGTGLELKVLRHIFSPEEAGMALQPNPGPNSRRILPKESVRTPRRPESCDRPMEVCLQFGSASHLYVGNGLGRSIDQEEALALLKRRTVNL